MRDQTLRDQMSRLLPSSVLGLWARNHLFLRHNPFDQYTVKIADTKEELESAFHLIHDFEKQLRPHHKSGMRLDAFHLLPTSSIIILIREGEVAGTITAVKDSSWGLPCESHGVNLSAYRKGKRLVEVTSLAMSSQYSVEGGKYFFLMMKYLVEYIEQYMRSDTLIMSVHPSMKIFLEEVLYLGRLPGDKAVASSHQEKSLIVRSAFLPELHQVWTKQYEGRPKDSNIKYFFDEFKDPRFVFPNRVYQRDHDPVINSEIMGHFLEVRGQKEFFNKSDQHKLTQAYHNTPIHKVLREIFQLEQESILSRRQVRHDVYSQGNFLILGDRMTPSSTILNVSQNGISILLKNPGEQYLMEKAAKIELEVQIGANKSTQISVEPVRWDKDSLVMGFKVVDASNEWQDYIDFLNSEFMKDVFPRKKVG